ncbi:hypothetical protein [Parvularcula marina]
MKFDLLCGAASYRMERLVPDLNGLGMKPTTLVMRKPIDRLTA